MPRVASIYRNKLWALSLVQYASVVFIDSDMLLRRNLDHLFLSDRFTVARDNISPLSAALWAANPSCQVGTNCAGHHRRAMLCYSCSEAWNDPHPAVCFARVSGGCCRAQSAGRYGR